MLVFASSFGLVEQNASGLGNAYAGGAAVAEDASTIFYNPAGMSRLTAGQWVVGTHLVKPTARFQNRNSSDAVLQSDVGGDGGDAGHWALLPSAYISKPLNEQWHIGLGFFAPFGLESRYERDWRGRFQAIRSKIMTLNLNPSVAYQLKPELSLGAGLNVQYASAILTNQTNYAAIGASAGVAAGAEGETDVVADDFSLGYNLGLLWSASEQTRVGLAYRSAVDHDLSGDIKFHDRPSVLDTVLPNGDVSFAMKMPSSASLSVFHQLSPKWDVMADATWTGWSTIQEIKVVRDNGQAFPSVPEKWHDTKRLSLGLNHHYDDKWTVRTGVAWDESPVDDKYRNARLPDSDRTWLALGGQYRMSNTQKLDFAYAHYFMGSPKVADDQTAGAAGKLSGQYDNNHIDTFALQYTKQF